MSERDERGVRSAARFALQPNMWGFCGEDTSQDILREFVALRKNDSALARETLEHHGFPHLNSFLEAIAERTGLDTFSDEVVMSYWLGNKLTEDIGTETKKILVECYGDKFTKVFAEQLKTALPENIYLTHLSQVALIAAEGYDQLEKSKLINHCMLAHGRILEIDAFKKTAVVSRDFLKKSDKDGYVVRQARQKVKIDSDLTPVLCFGDDVAVHLGYLAMKLDEYESKNLRYWTRKVAVII